MCGYEARYSMHYCLATAAQYGDVSLVHMRDDHMADPAVASVMDRVEFVLDEGLPLRGLQETEAYPTSLTLTLRDGRNVSALAFRRVGSGTTLLVDGTEIALPTTDAQMQRKWRGCLVAGGYEDSALEPLLAAINDLENATNVDRLIAALPVAAGRGLG